MATIAQVMQRDDRARLTGGRLGAFEIGAPIGEGGMGQVYRARDRELGRDVASKVVPAEWTVDADRFARFEREARLVSRCDYQMVRTAYSPIGPSLVTSARSSVLA